VPSPTKTLVLAQYFGYLRRNPEGLPDKYFSSFDFYLNELNQFKGDYPRLKW